MPNPKLLYPKFPFHYKKISFYLVMIILLAILAGGFFCYYKYLAKGTLTIVSQTPEVNIRVNGKDYNTTDSIKLKLKSGKYDVVVSKESHPDSFYYDTEIKALRNTKLEVIVGDSVKVADLVGENVTAGEIVNRNFSGTYHTAFDAGNNRILLVNDKTIYYLTYSENQEEMQKAQLSKLIEIPIDSEAVILDIKWSDVADRVILKILEGDSEKNYLYTLDSQKLELVGENIIEACWLGNDQIGYLLTGNDQQKLFVRSDKQDRKLKEINSQTKGLFCTKDKMAYYFTKDKNIYLNVYNVSDNRSKDYLVDDQGSAIPLYSKFSPDSSKIAYVKMKKENTNKTFYIIDLGQNVIEATDLEIYTKEWLFTLDSKGIIYINSVPQTEGSATYTINNYNPENKSVNEISKFVQSTKTIPQDLILGYNGKQLFFINGLNLFSQEIEQ